MPGRRPSREFLPHILFPLHHPPPSYTPLRQTTTYLIRGQPASQLAIANTWCKLHPTALPRQQATLTFDDGESRALIQHSHSHFHLHPFRPAVSISSSNPPSIVPLFLSARPIACLSVCLSNSQLPPACPRCFREGGQLQSIPCVILTPLHCASCRHKDACANVSSPQPPKRREPQGPYTDHSHVVRRSQHYRRRCHRSELCLPQPSPVPIRPLIRCSRRCSPLSHHLARAYREHSDQAHGAERLTKLRRIRKHYWQRIARRCWPRRPLQE